MAVKCRADSPAVAALFLLFLVMSLDRCQVYAKTVSTFRVSVQDRFEQNPFRLHHRKKLNFMPEITENCGLDDKKTGSELRMEDPLKLENQLCFPLYAAARKIVSLYTPFFKPLGITYTQYIAFLVLWEKHTISVKDLCRILYLDSGTLTPMLKKMEEAGYVSRKRCATDERVVMVSLTPKGEDLKKQVRDIPVRVGTCISLEEKEAATMYTLLYKLLGKMDSTGK